MHRAAITRSAAVFEAFADVFVGDDRGLLLEEGVSAAVIAMIVRVDDESDRLAGNPLKCCLNLLGEGSRLVIDENNAIVAHRCCDISAGSLQHVDVASDFADLDLDFAEVLVLCLKDAHKQQTCNQK